MAPIDPARLGIDATAPSLGRVVRGVAACFRGAGLDTPELDARLLVAAATGVRAEQFLLAPEQPLGTADIARVLACVDRRLAREPVSRILGTRGFYGRSFQITPATLDPRPDTETLVDLVLQIVDAEGGRDRPLRVLDIGVGSGAILATLLAELPAASGLGTDLSDAALAVAQCNLAAVGVADRARLLRCRSLSGIAGRFDLVVSNPPYIPSGEIVSLAPEVRHYDPRLALDGGADGLDVYREIAAGPVPVTPGGWLVLEVGAGQADPVSTLLIEAFGASARVSLQIANDLGGVARCVAVQPLR